MRSALVFLALSLSACTLAHERTNEGHHGGPCACVSCHEEGPTPTLRARADVPSECRELRVWAEALTSSDAGAGDVFTRVNTPDAGR
jgi:hypothetical protein